ncbi:glucuronate isomerase [Lapidilactobacillus luobeiensis]|uniref:glucuronate isomerase n=1 Tax=Lapidilactobacillus luobeiensis TaxID=2950371 RepID=UPI0021C26816|nr:glucuronate isomerase [Lapidilactobacillus luobeiensis]
MSFLDSDFLLETTAAKRLFHDYAEEMPIIDFHCHLNPEEIYQNKNYQNITRIWLNEGTYGDHYKWRLMRANGVPEELITGDGDDYEKFIAWAKTIEKSIGNPLYEWTHLELRRFFGINDVFSAATAPAIWRKANALLATDDFKPRSLIRNSKVKVVCTTDDPASDLHYHQLLKAEENKNGFKVLPAMRPDQAIHLEKTSYDQYLQELGQISGIEIKDFKSLIAALRQRFEYFSTMGGRLSDHSLETFHFIEATEDQLNQIMAKARANEALTQREQDQYVTMLIENLMALNNEFDWTMQFHINSARNLNQIMFAKIGADTGYDAMGAQPDIVVEMQQLYYHACAQNTIPKTIFYSLNPNDWLALTTMMQSFQGKGVQRLQLGAAWWFNDTAEGMTQQLTTFAEQSLLPNFVGMLTDSRSFLSYPRHEYFRRVLCNYLGHLVAQGRVPEDYATLGKIVQDISYNNAHDYFGFFAE